MSVPAPAPVSAPDELSGDTKGLDYYEEYESAQFAGRERDVAHVLAQICAQRSVVLYGRSGLGKTSLLKAGLMPELRKRGFKPIYLRLLNNPVDDLLAEVTGPLRPADRLASLRVAFARNPKGLLPVLILDQFEEFYIRFVDNHAERAEFVEILTALLRDDECDFRVIFALREDYLAALDGFQSALPDLFQYSYRLGNLGPLGARAAIVKLLRRAGRRYEPELVIRLVDELARFDYDSARLQLACAELLRRGSLDRPLTAADLGRLDVDPARVGTTPGAQPELSAPLPDPGSSPAPADAPLLSGIFHTYLLRQLAPVEQRWPFVGRLVLEQMISRQDTKYALPRQALENRHFLDCTELDGLLETLERQRVLRRTDRYGAPWYELRHECLVPALLQWLVANCEFEAFVRVRRAVSGATQLVSEKNAAPLTLEQLQVLAENRDMWHPSPDETKYILFSAILSGKVEYARDWSGQAGPGAGTRMVLEHLSSKDANTRALAARGAAAFVEDNEPIVARLRALQSDPTEPDSTRYEAARTLGILLSDADLETFVQRISVWSPPRHARDFLAELEQDPRVTRLSWWLRFRVQRFARRRTFSELLEGGTPQTLFDLTFGGLASLVWSLTCPPYVTWLQIVGLTGSAWKAIPVAALISSLFGIILGPFVGWRLAVHARWVRAHGAGERPIRTLVGSKALFVTLLLPMVLTACVFPFALDRGYKPLDFEVPVFVALVAAVLGALLIMFLTGLLTGLITRLLPSKVTRGEALAIATVTALLAAGVCQFAASAGLHGIWLRSTDLRFLYFVAVVTLVAQHELSFCILLGIAVVLTSQPGTASKPRPFTSWRTWAVMGSTSGLALAVTGSILVHKNIFSAPLQVNPRAGVLTAVNVDFSLWPQGGRLRVVAPTQWVVLPSSIGQIPDEGTARLNFGDFSLVSAPSHQFVLAVDNLSVPSSQFKSLHPTPAAVYNCNQSVLMTSVGITFVCPVTWRTDDNGDSVWSAHLQGSLPSNSSGDNADLVLSIPSSDSHAVPLPELLATVDGTQLPLQYVTVSHPGILVSPWGSIQQSLHVDSKTHQWSTDISLRIAKSQTTPQGTSLVVRVSSQSPDLSN